MKVKIIAGLLMVSIGSILLGMADKNMAENINEEQVFYIQLSDKEVEAFDKKLAGIKVGQTWKDILTRLGEPDYEAAYADKKTGQPKGVLRAYYLAKLHSELVNEVHDRSVRLYFDNDDVLLELVRQN